MIRECRSAALATAIESSAQEEWALGNKATAADDYKHAARLEYECAASTSDQYAHDWYRYFYALDLSLSSDEIGVLSIARAALNDLAASTGFTDVRTAALKTKKSITDEIESNP